MKLSKVFIKNYRNFLDEEININEKSLIIGANDVGKTNLLNAIRLLLDKSFSILQLEPEESDFNIFSDEDEIQIILEFSDIQTIQDNYIFSKLGKYISNNTFYLAYVGFKDLSDPYKIYIGHSRNIDEMTEFLELNILV